ncbi:MAG: VacJ family lipoprotein [SAR324 cluster bacterium]|nr:VacJ family lipoprotein [SAR324 cluster bacterium]
MIRKAKFASFIVISLFSILLVGCSQQKTEKEPSVATASKPAESGQFTAEKTDAAEDEEFDEFEAEFKEAKQDVSDPFEGYNRAMTTFNDKLFMWVINPLANGYRFIIPEAPRQGVKNFLQNLLYPLRFANNLLQFKVVNAGEETLRFVTNSTIGILGLWDPAMEWFDLQPHEEDFGQTLGFYGVGAGPHIVLPFLGPSNLRDTFSMVPDNFLDPTGQREPIGQTDSYLAEYGILAFKTVNRVSLRPGEYESLKSDAVDFYPFLRDSYEQMRNKQIEE